MLAIAKEHLGEFGSRINLKHKLLADISGKHYNTVISSDTLHHIHNPQDFWSTIKRIAQNFYVTDLLRPESIEKVDRIIRVLARTDDEVYKEDFRNSLCAAFTVDELRAQLDEAGIEAYEMTIRGDVCKTVYIHGCV
jgi:hypothetical protein